jgi:hypothetical protein
MKKLNLLNQYHFLSSFLSYAFFIFEDDYAYKPCLANGGSFLVMYQCYKLLQHFGALEIVFGMF